jgi:hypothetical protein
MDNTQPEAQRINKHYFYNKTQIFKRQSIKIKLWNPLDFEIRQIMESTRKKKSEIHQILESARKRK